MIKVLLCSLTFLIFFEFFIFILFSRLKKKFKWLISSEDLNPMFTENKFQNFIKKNYDKLLGWDRKPETSGFEISNRKTHFKINKFGFRGKKKYKRDLYNVFGDSFAFCRYVNDNETWQYHLSKKNKKNVLNFGVGNFGLDQAFLKYLNYKKKLNKQKIIFCVVPETIARINSYWKHYREFKNIFGIKPIIKINNTKLKLVKIPYLKIINTKNDLLQFDNNFIKETKKNDIFYNEKFKKNLFKFPFLFSFLKNTKHNSKIFYFLLMDKVLKKINKNYRNQYYEYAYSQILEQNIKESHNFYENSYFKRNLKKLIEYMNYYFKKKKINFFLLIVPQYYDLKLSKSRYKYINFYKKLNNPKIIDLSDDILKSENWSNFYFKNKLGGHLNKSGNKFLANLIYSKFKND